MNPYIQGKRINLIELSFEDLEYLENYPNDESITKYMIMGTFPNCGCIYCSDENIYKEYNIYKKNGDIIFCMRVKDKIIGLIGLYEFNWISRNAELRIVIGDTKYLSKGYGREAVNLILNYGFNKLNLHKIRLGCNASDERANKCYIKCGFILEGITRDYHFRNGEYYNANMYSILDKEWRKNEKEN